MCHRWDSKVDNAHGNQDEIQALPIKMLCLQMSHRAMISLLFLFFKGISMLKSWCSLLPHFSLC